MNTSRILVAGLALFFIVARCQAVTLNDQMIGNWPFDETSGSVAHDASGHGLNGSLVNYLGGQPSWSAGVIGGSLHFGGLSARQYVQVPDFTKPTSALTISAWIWADSMPQWATIAANWNGLYGTLSYGLFGSDSYLSLYFAQPDPQGINVENGSESFLQMPPLSLGQWHHVAVVVNGPAHLLHFWRDGTNAGSFLIRGDTFYPAPVPQLNIGGEPSYGNPNQGYWDGRIDDIALWTRALSQSEIQTIYAAGLAGIPVIAVPEPQVGSLLILLICSAAASEARRRPRLV